MKKLVSFFAAVLLLAGASVANAQGYHRLPHPRHYENAAEGLGLHFGYAHSFYRISDKFTENVEPIGAKDGFHVGLTKDFTLIPYTLYINSGLDYVYLMDNPDVEKIGPLKVIAKGQDHRLDIPIKLKYEYPVTPIISAFAEVGPRLSFGLASNLKYRARTENGASAGVSYNYFTGKIRTTGEADIMKDFLQTQTPDAKYRRFDAMLGGAVGAKFFDILEVSFGYDWGIVNQYRGVISKDYKMRRQQLYVTVGVRF